MRNEHKVDERNYGIDGLRLILMLMIISFHCFTHGGLLDSMEPGSLRHATAWMLTAAVYGSVNCFGMISGYVGVKSKYRIAKVLYLWIEVWFYAVLCSVVLPFLFLGDADPGRWCRSILPLTGAHYWFYLAYFGMSLFVPFINRALVSMSMREAKYGIIALFGMISVFQTVIQAEVFGTMGGYGMVWLMIMYTIGGYYRLYGDSEKWFLKIKKHGIWVYAILTVVSGGYQILNQSGRVSNLLPESLLSYISPTVVMSAFALLAVFSEWKPNDRLKRIIAFLAPSAFSIYLIHDSHFVRQNFISNQFRAFADMKVYVFPFALVGTAFIIFAACIAIDLIRRKVFEIFRIKQLCDNLCRGMDRYFFDS